jgi:DNA-binding ferritin-like protein
MADAASGSVGASAGGLARVVADAFMLRSQTELALWRVDGASPDVRGILERLRLFLDEFIQAVVMRIQILGGHPPRSLVELRTLSSVSEPTDDELMRLVVTLGTECGTLKDGCRMVAMLARESGDDTTDDILSRPVATLEEAVWRLHGLSSHVAPDYRA